MALTKIDDRGLKTPIDLQDNEKIRLGTGNDLEIYHDGSNSYLTNDTGILNIQGGGANIQLQAVDGESGLIVKADDAVELYYNGSKKLETTNTGINVIGSDGVTITGLQDGTADLFFHADGGDDNADKWYAGAYADGTFHILNYASGSWEETIKAAGNGAVELYHDNSKKFETYANGCTVTGNLNAGNVDLADNAKARFGTSNDLEIYHDPNENIIKSTGTSDFKIKTDTTINITKNSSEDIAKFIPDGAVELYHDNTKTFQTTANGIELPGSNSLFLGGKIDMPDNDSGSNGKILLGTGDDLEIYHDGSHTWMKNATGRLILQTDGDQLQLRGDSVKFFDGDAGKTLLEAKLNGSVDLYYDNVKQLATTRQGIDLPKGVIQGVGNGSMAILGGSINPSNDLTWNFPFNTNHAGTNCGYFFYVRVFLNHWNTGDYWKVFEKYVGGRGNVTGMNSATPLNNMGTGSASWSNGHFDTSVVLSGDGTLPATFKVTYDADGAPGYISGYHICVQHSGNMGPPTIT